MILGLALALLTAPGGSTPAAPPGAAPAEQAGRPKASRSHTVAWIWVAREAALAVSRFVAGTATGALAERLGVKAYLEAAIHDLYDALGIPDLRSHERADIRSTLTDLEDAASIMRRNQQSDSQARRALQDRFGNLERWARRTDRRLVGIDSRLSSLEQNQAQLSRSLRSVRRTIVDQHGRLVLLEGVVVDHQGQLRDLQGRLVNVERAVNDNRVQILSSRALINDNTSRLDDAEERMQNIEEVDSEQDRAIATNTAAINRETRYQRHVLAVGARAGVAGPLEGGGTPDLGGEATVAYNLDGRFELYALAGLASVRPSGVVSSADTLVWDSAYLGVGLAVYVLHPSPGSPSVSRQHSVSLQTASTARPPDRPRSIGVSRSTARWPLSSRPDSNSVWPRSCIRSSCSPPCQVSPSSPVSPAAPIRLRPASALACGPPASESVSGLRPLSSAPLANPLPCDP